MSAHKMALKVEDYGIRCERKSIYSCLESLEEFGFDIIRSRKGAFMNRRVFEIPELKILVDAVQASRFITEKKANELIKRISTLTDNYTAKQLERQVYVRNRVRTMNESIYYNIDTIQEAISQNEQVYFQYMSWDSGKQMVLKHEGKNYRISPWCLIWEREKYYLLGYEGDSDKIKHFRVDKMKGIKIISEKREGKKQFEKLDMTTYTSENFSMFQGRHETVTLSVEKEMAGVIIDRFGKDVWMHEDNGKLTAVVDVAVSPQFFGWLTALGGKVRIDNPVNVIEEYKQLLKKCM